jgi:uncharacterized protein involved in response to NO
MVATTAGVHAWTVGVAGTMTPAVISRASRSYLATRSRHSAMTQAIYAASSLRPPACAAERSGKIIAIAHESSSGDLPGGKADSAVHQTDLKEASRRYLIR